MKVRILVSATALLCAMSLFGQQQGTIDHTAGKCVLSGEMPLMHVSTVDDGQLRAYFRRVGTTDWCSVDGQNLGKASIVIFPRFDAGTEIEYYFVVLRGRQVVAKSPLIYRTRATAQCEADFARHSTALAIDCAAPLANPIASSLNAGYHAQGKPPGKPPVQSPERPERQ